MRLSILAGLGALAVACGDVTEPEPVTISEVVIGDVSMTSWTSVGLLFVVDGTPAPYASMLERFSTLANGMRPDVRFGVTTTRLQDGGRARGGVLAASPRFDLGYDTNFEGTFERAALDRLAVTPTEDRTFALDAALLGTNAAVNGDLIRGSIPLAVVFSVGRDDEGTLDVTAVAAALRERRVVVAVTAPCGVLTPRLDALVAALPGSRRVATCERGAAQIIEIADVATETLEARCLDRTVLYDTDPSTPDVQPDCTATLYEPTPGGDSRTFAACAGDTSTDCYKLEDARSQGCEAGTGLALQPSRYPFPSKLRFECLLAPR